MSFIPQITCRHCGKKYSALLGRCPACGTRHVKQTTRSTDTTASVQADAAGAGAHAAANSQWQLIFGGILIVAVIVAVIILISASLHPVEPKTQPTQETPPNIDVNTQPPTPPPPTETPEPTATVTSITIYASYDPSRILTDFTQRTDWADTDLDADVYPTEARATAKVTWRSSDENVCTVDENGVVKAVGIGNCEIYAECGGVAQKVIVYVPG